MLSFFVCTLCMYYFAVVHYYGRTRDVITCNLRVSAILCTYLHHEIYEQLGTGTFKYPLWKRILHSKEPLIVETLVRMA